MEQASLRPIFDLFVCKRIILKTGCVCWKREEHLVLQQAALWCGGLPLNFCHQDEYPTAVYIWVVSNLLVIAVWNWTLWRWGIYGLVGPSRYNSLITIWTKITKCWLVLEFGKFTEFLAFLPVWFLQICRLIHWILCLFCSKEHQHTAGKGQVGLKTKETEFVHNLAKSIKKLRKVQCLQRVVAIWVILPLFSGKWWNKNSKAKSRLLKCLWITWIQMVPSMMQSTIGPKNEVRVQSENEREMGRPWTLSMHVCTGYLPELCAGVWLVSQSLLTVAGRSPLGDGPSSVYQASFSFIAFS